VITRSNEWSNGLDRPGPKDPGDPKAGIELGEREHADRSAHHGLDAEAMESALIEIRYEGYIERQRRAVERASRDERLEIPEDLIGRELQGLSREAHEKIARFKPSTVGQASRLPGISPSDVAVLTIYAERERRRAAAPSS
jgi:tRNA uridine 5-carboxymethylaminomethyl modification enzyme